jgi:hypothetical protein
MAGKAPVPSEETVANRKSNRELDWIEGTFEVIGKHAIAGYRKGEKAVLSMSRKAIESLIEAGHIKPVVEKPAGKEAAKPTVKKENNE